jgi:enoyl-CoA hydratase/carnithine racemase
MAFATIELDARGAVGSIELNRPDKLNPLSAEALRELAGSSWG